jgi:tagatose 1,6-diphosphate aldolase
VMEFVEGTRAYKGVSAYTREAALGLFRSVGESTAKPFIYLSAGVSNPVFIETLELAGESGVAFNGVLCGRATWADGIDIFAKQGPAAFQQWLDTQGVENIENVNHALEAATPWTNKVEAA